jgi:hypothetical protein
MVSLFDRAEKLRCDACEQGLQLILNELSLSIVLCSFAKSFGAPAWKCARYEKMARERLGRAVIMVRRVELTDEQNERFCEAFRELTDLLPLRPPASIIPIDSLQRSA